MNEMKTKNLLTAVLIFLIAGATAPAQSTTRDLDLPVAIEYALKNHPRVKQSEIRLLQKKEGKREAFGNFLPKINLAYSYTHLDEPISIDLSPIRDAMITLQSKNQTELSNIYTILGGQAPLTDAQKQALTSKYAGQLNGLLPEFKSTLKRQDYWTGTLTGVQPLFTGGKLLAASSAADIEYNTEMLELEKIKNEVATDVIDNWLNVVFLNDLVRTRESILAGMKLHRDRAEKMLAEGLIARYNYLRACVAVSDAERNLFDDKKKLELAMLALTNAISLDEGTPIVISDSLVPGNSVKDAEYYASLAEKENPLIRIIDQKSLLAGEKTSAERAKYLPVIAAFGKYEFYPEYLSAIEPRWAVGVSLNLNLFNGFQDQANLEKSRLLEKEISLIRADATSKIRLLVNKYHKASIIALERYDQGAAALELAQENLRLNEKRFETGLGTSLEVVDARLMLEKSEIDRKVSLYDYYKNMGQLYNACGKPLEFINIWNKPEEKLK